MCCCRRRRQSQESGEAGQWLACRLPDTDDRPHSAFDGSVRRANGTTQCVQEWSVVLAFIRTGHNQVDGTIAEVLGSDDVDSEHDLGQQTRYDEMGVSERQRMILTAAEGVALK